MRTSEMAGDGSTKPHREAQTVIAPLPVLMLRSSGENLLPRHACGAGKKRHPKGM
jgi:hypothetical protein